MPDLINMLIISEVITFLSSGLAPSVNARVWRLMLGKSMVTFLGITLIQSFTEYPYPVNIIQSSLLKNEAPKDQIGE